MTVAEKKRHINELCGMWRELMLAFQKSRDVRFASLKAMGPRDPTVHAEIRVYEGLLDQIIRMAEKTQR